MNGEAAAGIVDWVLGIMLTLGYPGVALLVALDNVFPPIPSEVILPLAGVVSGQGHLSLPGVIAAATVGSVAGALPLYGIGRWLGDERLRRFVRRFGRALFVTEADLDRAQRWFDRHGAKAVLLGRCVPLVRSLVSVPAGLAHMPRGRFVSYTALGSAAWNTLLISVGFVLGERWELVRPYLKLFEYVVVAGVAAALLLFLWRRLPRSWLRPRPTPAPPEQR